MKYFLSLFLFLSILLIPLAKGTSLKYQSEICQNLSHQSSVENMTCIKSLQFYESSAISELINASENLETYSSVNDLKNALNKHFQNNILNSYKQNLIIAHGLGVNLNGIDDQINALPQNCGLSSELKPKLKEFANALPKDSQFNKSELKNLSKLRHEYKKRIRAAMIEHHRISTLLKEYERNKPDDSETILGLKKDLLTLYQFYPILAHVSENGNRMTDLVNSDLAVIKGGRAQEDMAFNPYFTHQNINQILKLPRTHFINTRTEPSNSYAKRRINIHDEPILNQEIDCNDGRKVDSSGKSYRIHAYEYIHHYFQCDNKTNHWVDTKINDYALSAVQGSFKGIEKLCDDNSCESFKLIPDQIGKIVSKVVDENAKTSLQKFICDCEIEKEDETFSTMVHLGIAAGTIGAAIGCIAFAPVCAVAAVAGIAGAGLGISDFNTTINNTNRTIAQTRAISAVSDYQEDYLEQLKRLELAKENESTAYLFLPLEFLGAGGDFAVVTKTAYRLGKSNIKAFTSTPTPIKPDQVDIISLNKQGPASIQRFREIARGVGGRDQFVKELENFDIAEPPITGDGLRGIWIDKAKNNNADVFLEIENGRLKRLNDLGDKEVVTSLTNMHKKLMFDKIKEFEIKYPGVKVDTYSDFKSMRFALTGDVSEAMKQDLTLMFRDTIGSMDAFVKEMTALGTFNFPPGELPHLWFSGGFGKSADQAGLASRSARCRTDVICDIKLSDYANQTLKQNLNKHLENVKLGQAEIVNKLRDIITVPPLLTKFNDDFIPSVDLIEVIRKNLDLNSTDIGKLINQKFGVDLSDEVIFELTGYINNLKRFEPGLWVETRKVASLKEAKHGGFSADFTGMGSYNIEQIAKDISGHKGSIDELVSTLRKGEQTVTSFFNKKKKDFNDIIERAFKDSNVPIEQVCSGDDCIAYPLKGLAPNELQIIEKNILLSVNRMSAPDGLRLSFVPPGASSNARSQLGTHGELIEKGIRKLTFGTSSNELPVLLGKDITVAVKMPKTVGKGKVKIMVASQQDLTPGDLESIESYAKMAIEKANDQAEELARESGQLLTSTYNLESITYIK